MIEHASELMDQAEDFHPAIAPEATAPVSRRNLLASLASLGLGTAVFQRALVAQVEGKGPVTVEMVKQAEWIAGLELTEEERKATASSPPADPAALSRPCARCRWATRCPPALSMFIPSRPGLRHRRSRVRRNQATAERVERAKAARHRRRASPSSPSPSCPR